MSDWSDLGLPTPQRRDYGNTISPGLLRTQISVPQSEQRSVWEQPQSTFALSVILNLTQLKIATAFLDEFGYSEFTIDLYSISKIRLISDYTVKYLRNGYFNLSFEAELLHESNVAILFAMAPIFGDLLVFVERPYFITTQPYPIDVSDYVAQVAPDNISGAEYRTYFFEFIGKDKPDIPSGTLIQTYFPHYYNLPWEDGVQQSFPDVITGVLGQTYYPHNYSTGPDSIQQSIPDVPTGALGQDLWFIYLTQDFDAVSHSHPDIPTGELS